MFGQSRPVVLEPYGRRRSRWGLPRWFVLLLVGAAIGVAGVILIQERYLPPRLSPAAGAELKRAFETADAARLRLQGELSETAKRLEASLADKKGLTDELAAGRTGIQALRDDLNSVVASLPRDPRGGPVEIRAAWFVLKSGALNYDLVITRERADVAPIAASLQFTIAGETAHGTPTTLNPKIVPVSLAGQQILRGSLPLPLGFKPGQTTIQILERNSGKQLGMRVMLVK
jgi:hypothetical protein